MNDNQSLMLQEAGQSPEVVATLLEKEKPVFAEIARLFSSARPSVVTTAARGSSDHAATFSNTSSRLPAAFRSPRSVRRSLPSMVRRCI